MHLGPNDEWAQKLRRLFLGAYADDEINAHSVRKLGKEGEHQLERFQWMLDDLHKAVYIDRLKIEILRGNSGNKAGKHFRSVDDVLACVDKADIALQQIHTVVIAVDKDRVFASLRIRLVCKLDKDGIYPFPCSRKVY